MVRKEQYRRLKFEGKIDGSVAEDRITRYGEYMVSSHAAIQTILVAKEEQAKTTILEPAGVSVNMIPFYLDAMREFCRISRNFTEQTKQNEGYNCYERWRTKGLDSNLLVQLAAMCDIDLWAYYQY